MSMSDEEQRYQEIMRRIAQSKNQSTPAPTPSTLTHILDKLNTYELLNDLRRQPPDGIQCYGPKAIVRKTWGATVIWYKRTGFNSHHQLYVLGVWAVQDTEHITISVGTKALTYSAPIFTAEAYHQLIRKDYTVYYDDDGSLPPSERQLFSTVYTSEKRLAIRQAIAEVSKQWMLSI